MERTEFLEIVKAHIRNGGQSYLLSTNETEIIKVVNRGLKQLTADTRMLPVYGWPIQQTAGRWEASTGLVCEVMRVMVDGRPLYNESGNMGPSSVAEITDRFPTWQSDAPGTPAWWAQLPDNNIVLYPAPSLDRLGMVITVDGFREHQDLISSAGVEGTIEIPDRYCSLAADWCCELLRRPQASAEDLTGALAQRSAILYRELQQLHQRNRALLRGRRTRKGQGKRYHFG